MRRQRKRVATLAELNDDGFPSSRQPLTVSSSTTCGQQMSLRRVVNWNNIDVLTTRSRGSAVSQVYKKNTLFAKWINRQPYKRAYNVNQNTTITAATSYRTECKTCQLQAKHWLATHSQCDGTIYSFHNGTQSKSLLVVPEPVPDGWSPSNHSASLVCVLCSRFQMIWVSSLSIRSEKREPRALELSWILIQIFQTNK